VNELYYGDNLDILRGMPGETVDLCYIDPPFSSQRDYNQIYTTESRKDLAQAQAFLDTWTWDMQANVGLQEILSNEGGRYKRETIDLFRGLRTLLGEGSQLAYLISVSLRLVEIHRVLKPAGSFYLHCDPSAGHYLKLVLDSVFGADRFLNEIVWKRTSGHNSAKRWGPVHDTIFFYSKSEAFTWNRVAQDYDEAYVKKFYRHEDENGRYRLGDLTGAGRRTGDSGKPWRAVNPTAVGRHWAVPSIPGYSKYQIEELTVQERLDTLNALQLIHWPSKGGVPQFKRYLDPDKGVSIQDVVTDIPPLSPHAKERLGYPTQKPEALLERIIQASSNPGDLVMDAYCGCGTTVAVAERLKRRWIGIDITYQSVSLIIKRLTDRFSKHYDVMAGVKTMGIPRDVEAAAALARRADDRTRKEFEKWAVLTYSNNRAVPNLRKGADQGIDGSAYFYTGKNETQKIVFQVKSGDVKRSDIATLRGDMEREGAELATLITLKEPTAAMIEEAAKSGVYHHPLMGRTFNRIEIVTVRDLVEKERRLDLPMTAEVAKAAEPASRARQPKLDLE